MSTGAQVASNNHGETVNEVATGPKVTEAQDKGKGKGKAVEGEWAIDGAVEGLLRRSSSTC